MQPALADKLLIQPMARSSQRADAPLRRLVETSPLPAQVIADADHRLPTASAPPGRKWGQTAASLMGCSLWRYAAEAVQAAEADLHPRGWRQDAAPAPAEVRTTRGNAGLELKAGLVP